MKAQKTKNKSRLAPRDSVKISNGMTSYIVNEEKDHTVLYTVKYHWNSANLFPVGGFNSLCCVLLFEKQPEIIILNKKSILLLEFKKPAGSRGEHLQSQVLGIMRQ